MVSCDRGHRSSSRAEPPEREDDVCESVLRAKLTTRYLLNMLNQKSYEMEQMIKNIPLSAIVASPLNPRKTFDQTGIEELADNIKRQGLLQPITVRPIVYHDELIDGEVVSIPIRYEIVCGERRFRAVTHNGSETIPCIVRDMTDEEAFEAMITENLQRKDVDPIEEAFAFHQLNARGYDIEEIASRFGKSVRFIRERIALDALLPELKQWVNKGLMNIGAALHIAKLAEEDQHKFMEHFEPDEDDDLEDLEPITKSDAEGFTNNLFKRIASAEWDYDFGGSCQHTCERCPYNSANEGCLFNDLKVKKDDACCTNSVRWNAKRLDWWKHVIGEKSENLLKQGEELKPGKMVIAHTDNYYGNRDDYNALKQYCIDQGYKVVSADNTFERWANLNRNEESTMKKLMNGEAYVVLLIDSNYLGAQVYERCYALKKQEAKDSAEAVKVAQLVRDYKTNIDRSKGDIANEMRNAVAEFDLNAISWKAFTDAEWEILLTLLINASPCNIRYEITGKANNEAEFAKAHNTAEGRDDILRKWMRGKLSDSGVQYYPVQQQCQERLIEVWGIDDVAVKAKAAAKLAKKQSKIEKELTALGYDTEGKKLDF